MSFAKSLLLVLLAQFTLAAAAQEATIRKNLTERIPQLPKIDEISKTPLPGLYEVRVNESDILYTDPEGNYLIQGNLIDLRQQRNLTEERIDKLTAVDFKDLPLKDAIAIVRGDGKRKLAMFADPNCGYCKRIERDLAKLDNVTIYTFLYPILSPDSTEKSKNVWCSKDPGKSWAELMLNNVTPAAATCDASALQRNLALGRKYKITGTPTLIFANGSRVPGAVSLQQIEKQLAATNR